MACESPVEQDYMFLLEFDRGVKSYEEQPITISYVYERRTYRYTPDVMVVRDNHTELIEVKPKSKLNKLLEDEKFIRKVAATNSYCAEQNYQFKVVTDEDIRAGKLLKNIKFMHKFSRMIVPSSDFLALRNELIGNETLSIQELSLRLATGKSEQKRIKALIFSLLYSQRVICNLEHEISSSSIIRLP